jgi:type II secretory pathway component GspD/PulD (secretin)
LTSTEQKYFLKGLTVVSGSDIVRPEVETRDVGLDMEITPHINKSRNVTMEITQNINNLTKEAQKIQGEEWPTTKKRSFTASVAVRDKETIVLGGLVREEDGWQKTKVPFLGSLPVIGWFFSSKTRDKIRAELIVFITPYVLDTPEDIERESQRRREALHAGDTRIKGWDRKQLGDEDPIPRIAPPGGKKKPAQDPLAGLTPAQRRQIEAQERQYGKALKNVDQKTEEILREPVAVP